MLMVPAISSHAWWDGGHKLSGYIAYEYLSEAERDWVMDLLEEHPTHKEIFADKLVAELGENPDPEARRMWYFGQATVWADIVRNSYGYENAKEISAQFSLPERHYTDNPVFADEESRRKLASTVKPPDTVWRRGMKEPEHKLSLVQAMAKLAVDVPDTRLPKADRSVELTWLFHLAGDVHQPCHCAQLFHHEKFPEGDRGANGILILGLKSQSEGMRGDVLHAFWDSLHGGDSAKDHQSILNMLERLRGRPELWEKGREALAVMDPVEWLREGHALAETEVYTPELRERVGRARAETITRTSRTLGTRTETTVQISFPAALMEAYVKNAREVADYQIVKGGLRLGEALRRLKAAGDGSGG
jgi:hypothetical protein